MTWGQAKVLHRWLAGVWNLGSLRAFVVEVVRRLVGLQAAGQLRVWQLGCVYLAASAVLLPSTAAAIPACTANEIIAQEPNCGPTGNCVITKAYEVPSAAPCVFNFSGRNVSLASTSRITVGSGDLTIQAANFTMAPGALIDAQGTGTSGRSANGGTVRIFSSGTVDIQGVSGNRSRIDASANNAAGTIRIEATGNVTLNGRLLATNLRSTADGGSVTVISGGNLSTSATPITEILVTGGSQAIRGGGQIDLQARGDVTLATNTSIDIRGSNGGTLDVSAGGNITFSGAAASSTGEAGSGGTITISAGRRVVIAGVITGNGGTADPTAGGEGGSLSIETLLGDVVIRANLRFEGSDPDGDGGDIDIDANGDIQIASGVTVSTRSDGSLGVGGTVALTAARDIVTSTQSAPAIDVSGGGGGGGLDIVAGRNIVLNAPIDVSGRAAGGVGGDVSIVAGDFGNGNLTIANTVDVSGGPCSTEAGCGEGGTTDVEACTLTVAANGRMNGNAPDAGGFHRLTGRQQVQVSGSVTALATTGAGTNGSVGIFFPNTTSPVLSANAVRPTPSLNPRPLCTNLEAAEDCLVPCTTCGNGVIEFPEECDDRNSLNCDGCSSACRFESCPPAEFCAGGVACDPQVGCAICPDAPTPTPTNTRTPTHTRTMTPSPTVTATPPVTSTPTPSASVTATSSHSPTPSATPSRSASPTHAVTATPTNTSTASPTGTATVTPTATPTASATASATSSATTTATPTSTYSASPTATVTPSLTATATPRPSDTATVTPSPSDTPTVTPTGTPTIPVSTCVGDCGRDGEVTIDELVQMVNIALGTAPLNQCPAGDGNEDGEISIDEIIRAVGHALGLQPCAL
ncbi:MAG: hypothetical protein N3C12_14460 [Candidatus Binatia bacterium]|nr:hypothetical protein [Candidatus Binatia bacterium]